MSSAANHRARSHRSYSNKRSAMNRVQTSNAYNQHFFDGPMTSLFRKLKSAKESKTNKV